MGLVVDFLSEVAEGIGEDALSEVSVDITTGSALGLHQVA